MLNQIEKIRKVFKFYPEVKLAYFFGSRANGKSGPASDYDFAFYSDKKNSQIKFGLMDKISRLLKTDKVDIVDLGASQSPELKYNIIKDGKLIFVKEPYKVLIEPRILNEYFDFKNRLLKYNLTKP